MPVSALNYEDWYVSTIMGIRPYYGLNIFPNIYSDLNDMIVECNGATGKYLIALWSDLAHSSTDFSSEDWKINGKNEIFTVKEKEQGYVGITKLSRYKVLKKVVEFDINFNTKYSFATDKKSGAYDLLSVFLHELGHAVGLDDDSRNENYVMYKSGDPGEIKRAFTQTEKTYLKNYYKNK